MENLKRKIDVKLADLVLIIHKVNYFNYYYY